MARGSKKRITEYMKAVKTDCNRYHYLQNGLDVLIKDNVDINTQDQYGNTLLHLAVHLDNLKLLRMFLKYGVMADLANEQGETPLHKAVNKGNIEMVKELIKFHCDINCARELEQTPLHLAVINGNLEMVELLVKSGADILRLDEINNLPIDYAIDEQDEILIKYFSSKQEIDEKRLLKIANIIKV